jgi:hypothetical protein
MRKRRIAREFLILALVGCLAPRLPLASSIPDPGEEILARIAAETIRRRTQMPDYSVERQYRLKNQRFGQEASATVLMTFRQVAGEHYTVLSRSGSSKLNGIIDRVIASEASASVPPENLRHQLAPHNYRARLLRTESFGGRNCYVIQLTPKVKAQYLISGKVWVDMATYSVLRIDGQFAASLSMMVGTPRITQDFVEIGGFWLPGHVHSSTSSFFLGSTELDIAFSKHQLGSESIELSKNK